MTSRLRITIPLRFALLSVACLTITARAGADTIVQEPLFLSTTDNGWAQPAVVEASLRFEGIATAEGAKMPSAGVKGQIDLKYRQTGLGTDAGNRRVVRSLERFESTLADTNVIAEAGRLLVAEDHARGARVSSVEGPLTRSQLDTIQLAADPLDIDAMLPNVPVRDGATWKLSQQAVERLLRLQADKVCDVVAIVSDVTPNHVRLRFAGPVHGTADGAEVEIELRGVALFDRSLNRLTKFNLAWKESRTVGPATPAIEARAKLNLVVRPATADERLAEADRKRALVAPVETRLLVKPQSGWQLLADRDWFVVAQAAAAATMRRIDGADVVAVATFTERTRTTMTAPQFEREVRYALGEQLGQVVSTSNGKTLHGDDWLSVASVGQADDKPVTWRHDHVSAGTKAIAVTTTRADTEDARAEAAIRQLVDSLEPTEATATAAAELNAVRR